MVAGMGTSVDTPNKSVPRVWTCLQIYRCRDIVCVQTVNARRFKRAKSLLAAAPTERHDDMAYDIRGLLRTEGPF